jgi:cytidylate kinase
MPINIAIDGPVGAGKSTISDAVASRLGILHLDTGAMYRAMGLYAIEEGLNPQNESDADRCAREAKVDVRYQDGKQQTLLNGRDVTDKIRTDAVSAAASAVSKWPSVRHSMVSAQRELASKADMLIDGRDIGTNVLKEAPVKIYLTASAEERAKRRYKQNLEMGIETPYEQIYSELLARDEQDMNRKNDPLRQAEDAVLLDSTALSLEETVNAILACVRRVYGEC